MSTPPRGPRHPLRGLAKSPGFSVLLTIVTAPGSHLPALRASPLHAAEALAAE
jgi:hypothetical protein